MKYLLTVLLLLVSHATLQAQSLQDSLRAHFTFDGSFDNSSPIFVDMDPDTLSSTHHPWPVSMLPFLTDDRMGHDSSAVDIRDGGYLYLVGLADVLYPPLPITFSSWIYLRSYQADNIIMDLGCYYCSQIYIGWENYGAWFHVLANGKLSAGFGDGRFGLPNWPAAFSTDVRRQKAGSSTLPLNSWHHVAAVVSGPHDIRLFIDGKEDCGTYSGISDTLVYCYTGWSSNAISGMNNTTSYYLDGKLDDLRVWSRALSEQEIMQLQDLPPGVTVVDTTICQGDSLTLFGGYSDAYQWGPAAGLACDTCAMPLAIPQVTTTYRLFTNNGFGCVDTYSIRVFVEDCTLPACAAVPLGASFHAVASGLGVTLSDQSGGQVDSVVFDLGNGVQLAGLPGQVFAYTYPQAGSYQVCLRAYARLGPDSLCVDSSCLTVQASPGVACDQLNVSVDFSQQVQGLVATFSDQSSGGSYDGVSWSFGDGSTLVGQPGGVVSHSYPGAGSY